MIRKEPPEIKNDYHRPHDTWIEQPLLHDDGESVGSRRVPNLRSRRTIFTVAMTAFTVGALLIIGASPYKNDFLAPGPLCSSHAQILTGQGADRCAACHGASDKTLAAWLTDTLTGGRTIPVSQSDLCMKCHENLISPSLALNPHSVALGELKTRTEKLKQVTPVSGASILQVLASRKAGSHAEIACSACHREHHGSSNLAAVTDQQCQSCHAQTFDSFEGNHPEFTNWPQQRRSRIAFDHSTHAMKHFPGKSTEFNCTQCHVDGPYGNVKRLASFEQSCAACHGQQIQQSGESGFAIFSLPSVDPEAVESHNLKIGKWPLAATGDFDGRLPPAMRLLLHADPVARRVLKRWNEKYGPIVDFADVDPAVQKDVAEATELVWAIKRLLNELATDGQESLRMRLSYVLGSDVQLRQVALLASELDKGVFRNTVRRWLPDLKTEIAQYDAGGVSRLDGGAIRRGRIDSTGLVFFPVKFSKQVPTDDDVLAINPLAGGGVAGESLSLSDSVNLSDDQPERPSTDEAETGGKSTVAAWDPPVVTRAGWYRDDELFRVFYRPGGHEDPCLKAWSDLAASTTEANVRPEWRPLFNELLSDKGLGLCATCHTVDQLSDESFKVNWLAECRDPAIGAFTKFSHQPHTTQPHLRDCSACHDMSPSVSNKDSFASHDPSEVVSNFAPITKLNCVNCHRQGSTNSGCTHCHSYHVRLNSLKVDDKHSPQH